MEQLEIVHKMGIDEGYYDGEYLYVGKETPYHVRLGRNVWEVMEGKNILRTYPRDILPNSLLGAELNDLLADYLEAGWELLNTVKTQEGTPRAGTQVTRYLLQKNS